MWRRWQQKSQNVDENHDKTVYFCFHQNYCVYENLLTHISCAERYDGHVHKKWIVDVITRLNPTLHIWIFLFVNEFFFSFTQFKYSHQCPAFDDLQVIIDFPRKIVSLRNFFISFLNKFTRVKCRQLFHTYFHRSS